MSAFQATVYALQYGIPLSSYLQPVQQALSFNATNTLQYQTSLSTPDDALVVAPNVDTLYTIGIYDLAQHDLVLKVPAIEPSRYWNYAFYDGFGENFANIGGVNSNTQGEYLIRRAADYNTTSGVKVCDSSSYTSLDPSCNGSYKGIVSTPVTDGTLLGRILVRDNGTDLEHVRDLSQEAILYPTPRTAPPRLTTEPLSPSIFANLTSSQPEKIMQLLSLLSCRDPPLDLNETDNVQGNLTLASIECGSYQKPADVDLDLALGQAETNIVTHLNKTRQSLSNGWGDYSVIGLYNGDYKQRAAIAIGGYLALLPEQALYPQYGSSANGLTIAPGEAYLYTFSSKPPLSRSGFWSVTMYNSSSYLVSNPLNRYAIGDRSNLTYADGTLVYGANETCEEPNKPFQLLLQPSNSTPPSNWTSNWLPGPSDEPSFKSILRLYAASAELINGTWEYPTVERISAILA